MRLLSSEITFTFLLADAPVVFNFPTKPANLSPPFQVPKIIFNFVAVQMTAVFNDAALKLRKKETKPADQALTDSFNFSEQFKIPVVEIY